VSLVGFNRYQGFVQCIWLHKFLFCTIDDTIYRLKFEITGVLGIGYERCSRSPKVNLLVPVSISTSILVCYLLVVRK
jgi:hypothetical protein